MTAKRELESSLRREREACQGLHAELVESRDRRALLQRQVEAAEKDATTQELAVQEVEQKVARMEKDGEEVAAQLAEAQHCC